ETAGGDVVSPDPRGTRTAGRIFLDDDVAARAHGDVVHHLRPLGAVEQHVQRSAGAGEVERVEAETPEARAPLERRRGDEVEIARMRRIPRAILGPLPSRRADRGARRTQRGPVCVAEAAEDERAAGRNPALDVLARNAGNVDDRRRAVRESRALDERAAAPFVADVD